jgi:hypothetical protein
LGITETTETKQKMEEQRIFQTCQLLAIVSHEAAHLEAGHEDASSLCPCKNPPVSNLARGTLFKSDSLHKTKKSLHKCRKEEKSDMILYRSNLH